jgi:hypothetical protein
MFSEPFEIKTKCPAQIVIANRKSKQRAFEENAEKFK